MKTTTMDDIRGFKPCYDPSKYLPEDWTGTVTDILRLDAVPPQDRLWVVLRPELVDDKTARLFAVWCAREALKLIPNPDPVSLSVCDVSERFANGQATATELAAAWDAAWAAAWDAAWAAAWDAARAAARDAARAAAQAAARAAARDAARAAAQAAAWDAAQAAARDAAGDSQCKKLTEMLELANNQTKAQRGGAVEEESK